MLNINTALAVVEVVVSGCAEVVTSWQTGLSHPMHPSGQNSSHGQSQIVIYSLEITKFLIFSDNNKDFELTANAISSIPKTFSQTSRVVVAAIKKFDHCIFTAYNAIIA